MNHKAFDGRAPQAWFRVGPQREGKGGRDWRGRDGTPHFYKQITAKSNITAVDRIAYRMDHRIAYAGDIYLST